MILLLTQNPAALRGQAPYRFEAGSYTDLEARVCDVVGGHSYYNVEAMLEASSAYKQLP